MELRQWLAEKFQAWLDREDERVREQVKNKRAGEVVGTLIDSDIEVYQKLWARSAATKKTVIHLPVSEREVWREEVERVHDELEQARNAIRDHFGIPRDEEIEVDPHYKDVRRMHKSREQAQFERLASIKAYNSPAATQSRHAEIERLTGGSSSF